MNYCLDANTIIYYLKGQYPAIQSRLSKVLPKQVFISEIVYAELLFGVAMSRDKVNNSARLEAFVGPFTRLPFDHKASQHYADIRADLTASGQLIGPNDLLIAAIARANHMTFVTHNTREFSGVTALTLEDWTEE